MGMATSLFQLKTTLEAFWSTQRWMAQVIERCIGYMYMYLLEELTLGHINRIKQVHAEEKSQENKIWMLLIYKL